ncbi:aromatase/cyclase [Nocardia terpenica]|uniref:Cyclase n=1 Tax=Nocardia terpenica TaxID=455432 RepID=A0A6G9YYI0_9NOCA|nr:SRPBCC family protein [Nocardia terpenica]QIS18298.1 cyclase [Nocardia terpenica]
MAEHTYTHAAWCAGSPGDAYGLVADVTLWPIVFGPTVAVDVLDRSTRGPVVTEEFRITALVDDRVRGWTSRRELNADERTIGFRQEHARPPIESMSGTWTFRPDRGGTRVELVHRCVLADDAADTRAWLEAALDANSDRELGALTDLCAAAVPVGDLVLRCADTVPVADIDHAYRAIDDAGSWPDRLPHVLESVLTEPEPGTQDLRMTVRTPDGTVHRTRSIRLCTDGKRIRYKQLQTPDGLAGHSGRWDFDRDTATVTGSHLALLDPRTVTDREQAARLRETFGARLRANSRATLTTLTGVAGHRS